MWALLLAQKKTIGHKYSCFQIVKNICGNKVSAARGPPDSGGSLVHCIPLPGIQGGCHRHRHRRRSRSPEGKKQQGKRPPCHLKGFSGTERSPLSPPRATHANSQARLIAIVCRGKEGSLREAKAGGSRAHGNFTRLPNHQLSISPLTKKGFIVPTALLYSELKGGPPYVGEVKF